MTPFNLSRIQIAENHAAIMDLVECVMNLDNKIKELSNYTTSHYAWQIAEIGGTGSEIEISPAPNEFEFFKKIFLFAV